MNLLLDTHAILWWWGFPERLSESAREAIASPENTVFASPVSAFEIALKHRLGKLTVPPNLLSDFEGAVRMERWRTLPLDMAHAVLAGQMDTEHRDPFYRLLAAQAIVEDLRMLTCDRALVAMSDLQVLW
jgi:PIN domain nuclease of toxin-antitoxin system